MEIGSFIELQLQKGKEYYKGESNIARLNSGRAAIYHAARVYKCDTIWLPYYQCDTVRDFLIRKGIKLKYYHINESFEPISLNATSDEAVVLVNYYGIMSYTRMYSMGCHYRNVIIDNSQAFFAKPLENAMNVYSARKFIGVPDGAYVIGNGADRHIFDYKQGYSSDTSLFLLQRIEYGCEGKTYKSRMVNERRIDSEDICKMSGLTRQILDGTDYECIRNKRRENFALASNMFSAINQIDSLQYYDESCVPMVYPLVIEDETVMGRLIAAKHFQGHWWSYLINEMSKESFEYWLSRYVIPITIDQRYGQKELEYIKGCVL